jgi:hypothetical protein
VSASDDAINVANSLEAARALLYRDVQQHALVFIFNTEETIMQGSHGFSTSRHPWLRNLRGFVNLEAAAAAERELVFQTGPHNSWLAHAYAEVAPYPYASVLAQELFQTGVIPSDTDFRVYTKYVDADDERNGTSALGDYGIPGLDVAYVGLSGAYLYHTTKDDVAHVRPGAQQRCGENLLALLDHLINSEVLADPTEHEHDEAVFFDVLGLVMIVYSQRAGRVLNFVVAIGAFAAMFWRGWLRVAVLFDVGVLVVAAVAAVAAACVSALLLPLLGGSMAWFATPFLMLPLFALPAVCGFAAVLHWRLDRTMATRVAARDKKLDASAGGEVEEAARAKAVAANDAVASPTSRESDATAFALAAADTEHDLFIAAQCFWALLLLAAAVKGLGSGYVALHAVLWPLLVRVLLFPRAPRGARLFTPRLLVLHLCGLIIPAVLLIALLWGTIEFFVPLAGRTGTVVPSDVVIAVLSAMFVVIVGLQPLALTVLDPRYRRTIVALLAVFVLALLSARFVSPYTAERPKRLFAVHMRREFYSGAAPLPAAAPARQDSGLWLIPFDVRALEPLRPFHPAIAQAAYLPCGAVYCDVPWYFPVKDMIQHTMLLPAAPPALFSEPQHAALTFEVTRDVFDAASNTRRVHLRVNGSDHMAAYLNARRVPLVGWSFHYPDDPQLARELAERPHVQRQRREVLRQRGGGTHPERSGDDSFFMFFVSGNPAQPPESLRANTSRSWEFWLEVEGRSSFEIAVASHHMDQAETAECAELRRAMPEWVTLISWISDWKSFVV